MCVCVCGRALGKEKEKEREKKEERKERESNRERAEKRKRKRNIKRGKEREREHMARETERESYDLRDDVRTPPLALSCWQTNCSRTIYFEWGPWTQVHVWILNVSGIPLLQIKVFKLCQWLCTNQTKQILEKLYWVAYARTLSLTHTISHCFLQSLVAVYLLLGAGG